MVNNVIRVVNYVIAARPTLFNFMIADNLLHFADPLPPGHISYPLPCLCHRS
jgi:hypothetical protein